MDYQPDLISISDSTMVCQMLNYFVVPGQLIAAHWLSRAYLASMHSLLVQVHTLV